MKSVFLTKVVLCLCFACFSKGEKAKEITDEFYEPEGEISSPDFPNNYPENHLITYRIFTDNYIEINFEEFAVEKHGDACDKDFFKFIFSATSPNPQMETKCGVGLEYVSGGMMRGKGPLVMLFKSDADGTEKGYKFTYKFELRGPDPCRSNPCKYGGKCKRMATYYVCNCPPGVGGQNCELDLDECSSMPCKNAGKCENGAARYSCVCDNGFKGTMCEIAPNRCEPNPCLNNGRCIGRLDDFACQCSDEYMGDVCDVPIPTFPQPTTTTTKATTTKTTTTIPTTTTTQGADDSLSDQLEYDDYEEEDDEEESDLLTYVAMTLIFLMLVAAAYYCLVVKKRQKEKPAHKINLNKVTKKEEEEDFSPKQTKKKRRRVMSEKNDVTRVSSVDEKSKIKNSSFV